MNNQPQQHLIAGFPLRAQPAQSQMLIPPGLGMAQPGMVQPSGTPEQNQNFIDNAAAAQLVQQYSQYAMVQNLMHQQLSMQYSRSEQQTPQPSSSHQTPLTSGNQQRKRKGADMREQPDSSSPGLNSNASLGGIQMPWNMNHTLLSPPFPFTGYSGSFLEKSQQSPGTAESSTPSSSRVSPDSGEGRMESQAPQDAAQLEELKEEQLRLAEKLFDEAKLRGKMEITVKDLGDQLAGANRTIKDLEMKVQKAAKNEADLKGQITKLLNDAQNASVTTTDLSGTIATLRSEVQRANVTVSDLKVQIDTLERQKRAATVREAGLNDQIRTLQSEAQAAQARETSLAGRNAVLEEEARAAKEKEAELNGKIVKLENEAKKVADARSSDRLEMAERATRQQNLLDEKDAMIAELRRKLEERKKPKEEMEENEREIPDISPAEEGDPMSVAAPGAKDPQIAASRSRRMKLYKKKNDEVFDEFPEMDRSTDIMLHDLAFSLGKTLSEVIEENDRRWDSLGGADGVSVSSREADAIERSMGKHATEDLRRLYKLASFMNKEVKKKGEDLKRIKHLIKRVDIASIQDATDHLYDSKNYYPLLFTIAPNHDKIYLFLSSRSIPINGGLRTAILSLVAATLHFNAAIDPEVSDVVRFFYRSTGLCLARSPAATTKALIKFGGLP